MQNLPKITIVTPSYNQEKYLETAILSVLAQNYDELEYIIIDGGSTDESVEIIKKYNKNISYWCSVKDDGQSDAIVKGISKSTGSILGWINSDDALFPGALHKVSHYFMKNPHIDVLLGGVAYADGSGNITKCYEYSKPKMFFAKNGVTAFGQQGMFFRKNLYEKIGGIRTDFHYSMDTELLYRMIYSGAKIGTLRELIGIFRWHEDMKSINIGGRKAEETKIRNHLYDVNEKYTSYVKQVHRMWQLINGNMLHSIYQKYKLHNVSIDKLWAQEYIK